MNGGDIEEKEIACPSCVELAHEITVRLDDNAVGGIVARFISSSYVVDAKETREESVV